MYENPSLRRDACGLTVDDWACFLADDIESYNGPILLWWALVGNPSQEGAEAMSGYPFPDLLAALAADARVLSELASSSIKRMTCGRLRRRSATSIAALMRRP